MKELFFNTVHGELIIRSAMLDVDGTNLENGLEFKLDGKLIGETIGDNLDRFELMELEDVEKHIENKFL